MSKKKTQAELMEDMLAKPFDQRYQAMSRSQKTCYWISIAGVAGIILSVWFG